MKPVANSFRRATHAAAQHVAVYLLISATVTGCERTTPQRPAAPRSLSGALIAVIGPGTEHPQWPGIRGGAERLLAGYPAVCGYLVAPADPSPRALQDTTRMVLDHRPDVVCLYVADCAAARESISAVLSQQTLLVTMGARCSDVPHAGHVDVGWAEGAERLGASLSRVAAGRQSYLLVRGVAGGEGATIRYQRFATAAGRQHALTLLAERSVAGGLDDYVAAIEELLRQFPHAGLLVTLDPDVWLVARAGWDRDLRDLNKEFRFATLSAAPALWPRLRTGHSPGDAAALVGPLDGEIGFAAAQIAIRLLTSVERTTYDQTIPCEVVTPAELPDFARRYAESANGLDVSGFMPR